MTETRVRVDNLARKLSADDRSQDPEGIRSVSAEAGQNPEAEGKYVAIAPSGTQVEIPKELFVALSDFIKTRKCPGTITIHFRSGEIIFVEAAAKKRYR